MTAKTIAGYIQGTIYPDKNNNQSVSQTVSDVQASGVDTVILSLAHIGRDYSISPVQITGDIYFNSTLLFSKGSYVADPTWPAEIAGLIGGSVTKICLSIGGDGSVIYDFQTIEKIYTANGNSFAGTNLEANFKQLKATLPAISVIDMDCEETYDKVSFVAFCEMLIGIGFEITFCPYQMQSFWTGSLAALEASRPGAVKWWNLQCYSGGGGNDPANWASAIKAAIPTFDTDGYILASGSSRFLNHVSKPPFWDGDSTKAFESLMSTFKGEASVGGAFIWTLDQTLNYQYDQTPIPDPQYDASNGSIPAYVSAIRNGL